jgi:transcription antitermination factor NusG
MNENQSVAWYALTVRYRHEMKVSSALENKGFENFVPTCESRRGCSIRAKSIGTPLLPGFVFCRLDPCRRLPILTIPGVVSFVSIGRIPAPIDESEIDSLQTVSAAGVNPRLTEFIQVGQRVRIEEGPLKGVVGIVVAPNKRRHQLIVSITLLQRSVSVEVDALWLQPDVNRYDHLADCPDARTKSVVKMSIAASGNPVSDVRGFDVN